MFKKEMGVRRKETETPKPVGTRRGVNAMQRKVRRTATYVKEYIRKKINMVRWNVSCKNGIYVKSPLKFQS